MITATVGDLLDGKLDNLKDRGHYLYLVRDGETIFYIGQSIYPIGRLWEHLGIGFIGESLWSEYSMSSLGQLIKANRPESRSWQVELLTLADCAPVILACKHYSAEEWEAICQMPLDCAIDLAEEALIACCHPCLNRTLNISPTRLPDKYRDPSKEAAERLYKALLQAKGIEQDG